MKLLDVRGLLGGRASLISVSVRWSGSVSDEEQSELFCAARQTFTLTHLVDYVFLPETACFTPLGPFQSSD
jgi:hypothetical protein